MKYCKIRCFTCKGIGLVIKSEETVCKHCKNNTVKICCYCESKKKLGLYQECLNCFGNGEYWIDTDTNKKKLF